MAYTEFHCNASTGANVNGGSDAGSPSMSDTAGTGGWVSGTNIYTSVTTSGSVTVGQFMSIYSGAATVPAYTARITTVSGGSGSVWTITLSSTAISGVLPTTGSTFKAQVGGAWKGPNAAETHPVGYVTNALVNAAGNPPCVNMKSGASYSISTGLSQSRAGVSFEGYTTTVHDGGRATIDAGGNAILPWFGSGASSVVKSIIVANNGSTGTNSGFSLSGACALVINCVAHDIRAIGFQGSSAGQLYLECEAYLCNGANSANSGGFSTSSTGTFINCVSHDNAGTTHGFVFTALNTTGAPGYCGCIADTNGASGWKTTNSGGLCLVNCDAYNNASSGVDVSASTASSLIAQNCNFIKNTSNGITGSATATVPQFAVNCGFGSGTQANAASSSGSAVQEIGSVTYASGVTPWKDPANGDFRINLAAAIGTGRQAFSETQASYAGTAGTPVIGACQVADYPAVGNVLSGVNFANSAYTGTAPSGGVNRATLPSGVSAVG